MKLRALRLAEVGPFVEPVALEGLSGGLDVLIGPNEHGKSTLLRALRAALFAKHNAQSKEIDALKPYAGGHPLVEVDFEVSGRVLRIAKHFKGRTKGASAELVDLDTGRPLSKGEAAQDELAILLGIGDGEAGAAGLLWLAQGDALAPEPLQPGSVMTLREVIGREVETAASGGGARDLLQRVKVRLADVKTEKSMRAPANSAFAKASDTRERAAAQLAEARKSVARIEEALQAIADKRVSVAELTSTAVVDALAAAVTAARAALDKGNVAAAALAKVAAESKSADLELGNARNAREGFEQQQAEHARLTAAIAAAEAELAQRTADRETQSTALMDARATLDQSTRELATTRSAIEAQLRAARGEADRAELARLEATCASATELAAEIATAERDVATCGLTVATFAEIERLDRDLAVLDARCAAASPTLQFDLLPGAAERIVLDGGPLRDARTKVVDAPAVIEIAGIGRITIAPGANADRAKDMAARDLCRNTLGQALGRAGTASVAEARTRDIARRQRVAELGEARARLNAAAPDGMQNLGQRIAMLAERVQAVAPPTKNAEPQDVLEKRRAELERETTAATERARDLEQQVRSAETGIQSLASQLRNNTERRAELPAVAAADEAGSAELARLSASEKSADTHAMDLIRQLRAFTDAAPTPAQRAVLATAHTKAEQAEADHRRRSNDASRQLAELEGRVAEASGDGSGEVVAELEGEVARLDAEIARFELDRDALLLLEKALTDTLAETRSAFLAPVRQRLDDLLPLVLPGARLDLDDAFAVTGLARGAQAEDADRLSGGTREQIAVLVRLAFARLLADGGRPVPLVLDDPLVYADDGRLEAMFQALARGAAAHQVLVLSCHGRAFAPLVESHGGKALSLVPWRPD